MAASDPLDDRRVFDRNEDGVSWTPYPDELRRSSHALTTGAGVWVIDPVDVPELDDLLAERGDVAGVAVLLDRHKRDAAAVAKRHDVPVSIPTWFDGVASALEAEVERFDGELPGSDYEVRRVVNNRFWQEAALFDGSTLVVPEALGTAPFFTTGDRRLGVHPVLRPKPPRRQFGGLVPDRIRVGHGSGIETAATEALDEALAVARRAMPRLYANTLVRLIRG